MTLGAEAYALRQAVAARVAETPYEMVETEDGFDLRIELANARWYGLLGAAGRKRVVQHRVTLDEARKKFVMTDDFFDVRWEAGVSPGAGMPRLVASGEARRTTGRVIREVSFEKTFGVDAETKKPEMVVDYVFDASEGQRLVREPAKALGWSERWNTAAKVGTVFAVIGGGGAVFTLVFLLWALATGRFA